MDDVFESRGAGARNAADGCVTFWVPDPANVANKIAVLRFAPGGECFVRGEKVEDNRAIWQAFKDWLEKAKRDL